MSATTILPVTFQPSRRTVDVSQGTLVAEAAMAAGTTLDMPCGGEGACGKCRVVVHQGADPPNDEERRVLSADEIAQGYRLACQTRVRRPMTVEVPATSLLAAFHKILVRSGGPGRQASDPPVTKRYVRMPPPDRKDDVADFVRLQREIGPIDADLEVLRRLPARLREAGFAGTAVLAGDRLLDFEPGDTRAQTCALAVDVGTTTLVAMLVDVNSGEELAIASRLNPQTGFGDDVLSRILHTQRDPGGLDELQQLVVHALNEMIDEMALTASIATDRIYEVAFSGNTTMQHLLCGIDPRYLGEVPFVPATGSGMTAAAAALGVKIHPRGQAYVAPVIGGFVGGDTVCGALVTELSAAEGPSLLIDIGTNGELFLSAGGKLLAAAAAAGPAFEGARILHGMRGCTGAIERVTVDGDLRLGVIGGVAPVGICGSALIDLAAEMLRHGLLTPEGRLLAATGLPDSVPDKIGRRVIEYDGQPAFLVANKGETGTGRPIILTQRDVRQLQLASGAIRAGVVILLRRAGLKPADLHQVILAGGFGNYIRRRNAQRMGLLPPEIDPRYISYQGNTSLAGARLLAVSRSARAEAEALARRTEHVDLAVDHGFQWAFADAMIFPSGERPTGP